MMANVGCPFGQLLADNSVALAARATTLYRVFCKREAIPSLRSTLGATITVDVLIVQSVPVLLVTALGLPGSPLGVLRGMPPELPKNDKFCPVFL
jgi:hypothetical protein